MTNLSISSLLSPGISEPPTEIATHGEVKGVAFVEQARHPLWLQICMGTCAPHTRINILERGREKKKREKRHQRLGSCSLKTFSAGSW
jgi:hypothetical protein